MTSRNTDHVRLLGGAFVCLNCGARYLMNLPCPINVHTAAMLAYVEDHARCTVGSTELAPGVQLDLLKDQKL